jgi:hypothetical protein
VRYGRVMSTSDESHHHHVQLNWSSISRMSTSSISLDVAISIFEIAYIGFPGFQYRSGIIHIAEMRYVIL